MRSEISKDTRWTSRKYRAAWILTLIFVSLLVIPGITSLLLTVLWKPITFSFLPIEGFITFITLIWAAYFGANVTEKHKSFVSKELETDFLDDVIEDEGDGLGGQPVESDNP
jgi:hypothetical protein